MHVKFHAKIFIGIVVPLLLLFLTSCLLGLLLINERFPSWVDKTKEIHLNMILIHMLYFNEALHFMTEFQIQHVVSQVTMMSHFLTRANKGSYLKVSDESKFRNISIQTYKNLYSNSNGKCQNTLENAQLWTWHEINDIDYKIADYARILNILKLPASSMFYEDGLKEDVPQYCQNEFIINIYIAFNSTGTIYFIPAEYWDVDQEIFKNNPCKYPKGKHAYDARCRPWFDSTLFVEGINVIPPYKGVKGEVDFTFCGKIPNESQTSDLLSIVCIDFKIEKIIKKFLSPIIPIIDSFLIYKDDLKVLIHPKANYSIEEKLDDLIFGKEDSVEKSNFRNLTLWANDNFDQKPIYLWLNGDFNISLWKSIKIKKKILSQQILIEETYLYMGISFSQSQFQKFFSKLWDAITVQAYLYIFIVLVFVAVAIIGFYYCKKISNSINIPIKNLAKTLKKLTPENLEEVVELLNRTEENHYQVSYEMRLLYETINKVLSVVKFAKEALIVGDDGIALLNYSRAKRLYEELGNNEGVGICLTNLGNIHFKNKRFDEGCFCYMESIKILEMMIGEDFTQKEEETIINNEILENRLKTKADRYFLLSQCSFANLFQKIKNNKEKSSFLQILQNLVLTIDKTIMILGEFPYKQSLVHFLMIKKIKCFLKMDALDKALPVLLELEKKIQSVTLTSETELYFPLDILNQQFLVLKGEVELHKRNKREAAEFFTSSLETGKIYDSSTRKKALKYLAKIFRDSEFESKYFELMLDRFKPQIKDVIFLVDISATMSGIKIMEAMKTVIDIYYNKIEEYDRVSYVLFNDITYIVLSLNEKRKVGSHFSNILERVPETKGKTKLVDAIDKSISELEKRPLNINRHFSKEISYKKIILLITDGYENSSRQSKEALYQRMQANKISLIALGLTKKETPCQFLRSLAGMSHEGIFLNYDEVDICKSIFDGFHEIKREPFLIIESF